MNILDFFSSDPDMRIVDYLPIQLTGEEADQKRTERQNRIDEMKIQMGDHYLLAHSIHKEKSHHD